MCELYFEFYLAENAEYAENAEGILNFLFLCVSAPLREVFFKKGIGECYA